MTDKVVYFCGECGKDKLPYEMYSDFTCKDCAKILGLDIFLDENLYGM